MNQGERVSVKRVVANVIRNLDISDASRSFFNFVEWAFEAEKKIGSYKTFVRKFATLPVANKQAALPNDFLSVIDIKDASGTDATNYFEANSATFPDNTTRERRYYITDSTINLSTGNPSSIDISPNEMKKAAKIWNNLIPVKSYNGLLNL